ncbi:Bug family tripartite tricarboxylate transporter substrate binding protein [Paracidovorax sp. MALMAid1276]|uniref:Bug family tripartite tricarboxylate transporter substrate binding protein n=1 Tax=Paracidovorax sp. MALMAid1276 TaxID=3411631 RepID=UPI003B9CED18
MSLQSTKRTLMKVTAGALLLMAAPLSMAQAWPARPIRLVVPFPPGGLIDNMARLVGNRLAQELGQPIVIDNKPGAGGNVGAADAARAPADGYTLLMASPALTISPAIYKNLPYQPSQLTPVALLGRVPNVLLVNPASGMSTVQDLVGRAKGKPGQLNYASNGNGTSLHLSAELFKRRSETFITHVPYRGAAAAITALLSGEVDMMFDNLPSAIGQIQAGKLRALAVTTAQRSTALPDVPTLAEAGMEGFNVSAWFGVAAPAGLPASVASRLADALQKVVQQPEVVAAMQRQGADPAYMDAARAAAAMSADATQWKQVAAFAKIQLD